LVELHDRRVGTRAEVLEIGHQRIESIRVEFKFDFKHMLSHSPIAIPIGVVDYEKYADYA
jgi:hypothetical protein